MTNDNAASTSFSDKDKKAEPGPEIVLASNLSNTFAESLRSALLEEFLSDRLWLYVCGTDKKYEVSVANYWGGSLEDKLAVKVKKFTKEFVNDAEADTDPCPPSTEAKELDIKVEVDLPS